LKPYHFTLDGIESDNDLMNNEFGQYGEWIMLGHLMMPKDLSRYWEMRKTYFHQ
jgi:hypothetical protein